MNKNDLTKLLAERTGKTFVEAQQTIEEVFGLMTESLGQGEKVVLTGFGSFRVCRQHERPVRNPRTGKPYTLVPRDTVRFTVGARLFDRLNADKAGIERKSISKNNRSNEKAMLYDTVGAVLPAAVGAAGTDPEPRLCGGSEDEPALLGNGDV